MIACFRYVQTSWCDGGSFQTWLEQPTSDVVNIHAATIILHGIVQVGHGVCCGHALLSLFHLPLAARWWRWGHSVTDGGMLCDTACCVPICRRWRMSTK